MGLLLASYATAALVALQHPSLFRVPVMALGHLALAAALTSQAVVLERARYSVEGIQAFYRFIWALFYSEYALLLFI